MSKADIIVELPKLAPAERQEILERICELEEKDLLAGAEPTAEEQALLNRELEDYQRNPDRGSTWQEVQERLRKSSR